MFKKLISIAVGSLLLLALGWPAARPAVAAPAGEITYRVDSQLDQVDDNVGDTTCHTASGTCTLRAAIMQADQLPAALSPITINVPSGTYTLTLLASGADGAANGDLDLTGGDSLINLVGAGAASTIIDANQLDRVLTVNYGRSVTISHLTLRGGQVTMSGGDGAGIYNYGVLTVTDSVIRDNLSLSVPFGGGGIFSGGELTLINSTVAGNSANRGGGIFSFGPLTLINSTVSGNSANYGGGMYSGQTLTMINSTVSGNQAVYLAGGLENGGTANIYDSSIVFNWADSGHAGAGSGGGIFNETLGTVNLRNGLVAGNGVGDIRVHDDCAGTLHTYGNNLFGTAGDPAPCTFIAGDAGIWDNLNSLDLLGPLQDNGGPTLTHALLAGSNAIDTGDPAGCIGPDSQLLLTDQRGRPRTVGAACDIGAFEFLPPVTYLPFVGANGASSAKDLTGLGDR